MFVLKLFFIVHIINYNLCGTIKFLLDFWQTWLRSRSRDKIDSVTVTQFTVILFAITNNSIYKLNQFSFFTVMSDNYLQYSKVQINKGRLCKMSSSGDFGNPLRKFKLVFLGEQSGMFYLLTDFLISYMYIILVC